jgi:tRNA modification GTPase
MRSLQGEFSIRVHQLLEALIALRMYIESAIDFPEEEIDFLSDAGLLQQLQTVEDEHRQLMQSTRQGTLLHEGMTVVIAGRPNAGKSSLLNALAGKDSAIVTDIAGTTRDILREHIQIDGLPVHVIDTAGLRETQDHVEKIGVERAWSAIEKADRILLVIDDRTGVTDADRAILEQMPAGPALTLVRNKCDLSGNSARLTEQQTVEISLSAKTGAGITLLREHLEQCVGYQPEGEGEFIARRRHLNALERVGHHLQAARQQLLEARAGELAAEELRAAQQALNEITGEFTDEDLLGRIFTSFCIGK